MGSFAKLSHAESLLATEPTVEPSAPAGGFRAGDTAPSCVAAAGAPAMIAALPAWLENGCGRSGDARPGSSQVYRYNGEHGALPVDCNLQRHRRFRTVTAARALPPLPAMGHPEPLILHPQNTGELCELVWRLHASCADQGT